jgi:uridine kinase
MSSDISADAQAVLELTLGRSPTLGAGRLIAIDGPAGSGKTSLAAAIAALAPGARVVHMDDLYAGWSGLRRVTEQLDPLLRPLAAGESGRYRRFDWHADAFAETVPVPPVPLLILEGVGSGSSAHAGLVTTLVWVSAPHDLRMRRGIERDGDAFAPYWEQWARDEAELFAREQTEARADVHLDGTGATPPAVR